MRVKDTTVTSVNTLLYLMEVWENILEKHIVKETTYVMIVTLEQRRQKFSKSMLTQYIWK